MTFDRTSRLSSHHEFADYLAAGSPQRRAGHHVALLREGRRHPATGAQRLGLPDLRRGRPGSLAFVQRAKTLGVELDDLADLVRLWDGAECAPVQVRLRSLVHAQRAATRARLEELTQLTADLDAVSASIGDAACGPDCACVEPVATAAAELPLVPERLIGAACTLNSDEMRERLAEWRGLRDRATSIEELPGGARLTFDPAEPAGPIADLVSRESECCAFYTFTLRIDGPTRQLDISAGAGGEPAVRALIGIDR